MGVACVKFHGDNFCGWLKNRETHEGFLPQKFPRYIVYHTDLSTWWFNYLLVPGATWLDNISVA